MLKIRRSTITRALTVAITVGTVGIVEWKAQAQQGKGQAVNNVPNPYQTIENYFKLPTGRTWGSTSAVDIDIDGRSIWVAERCGVNLCLDRATGQMSNLPSVLKFDATGKLVKSFGQGLLIFPHGIHVDREGNVWVTDGNDDAPPAAGRGGGGAPVAGAPPAGGAAAPAGGAGRGAGAAGAGRGAGAPDAGAGAARGAGAGGGRGAAAPDAAAGAARGAGAGGGRGAGAPDAAAGAARGAAAGGGRGADASAAPQAARGAAPATIPGPNPGTRYGHQVFKFSPDGKVLMRLGASGGGAAPGYFYQPNDVITNAAGEIFVSEGHNSGGRILKFTKDGQFITSWGERGSGPGQFNIPHSLAFDSRGRLFVADRGNVRIQIFDQSGKFLEEWYQFSRISGLYIDKNDVLYAADSESSPTSNPGGWRRGIRIGSAKDGKVTGFIPDPQHPDGSKPSEGGGTSAAEGVAADALGNVYGAEVGPRKVQRYVRK